MYMLYLTLAVLMLLMLATGAPAATKDLGNGFADHGVATPVSNHRGMVATVDGEGRDVMLVWLFDHRGGYALLMIDAETGKADEIPMPFKTGDCPFASILSSGNKFYTHFGNYFTEFDPVQRKFTFTSPQTAPQMAMSMTEGDDGTIWSATYPTSGLASYDPKTKEFKDHGHLYKQNWAQYPRYVAVDDAGWVYLAIGSTSGQIVAFDPATAKATPVMEDPERVQGAATVYRDLSGKVYGHGGGSPGQWMELYKGERKDLEKAPTISKKVYISDSQSLFHRQFPSGRVAQKVDLINREMVTLDPKTKEEKLVTFDYSSEGAHMMGCNTAPDGTICGGTAFPMRFFSYNPSTDTWINRPCYGQANTVATQGNRWYIGGYGGGFLLEYDPSQPWVDTAKNKPGNPQFLIDTTPTIHRPHELLPHPDGKTIILAGTPGYGYTGGGLLFWDRQTREHVLLEHTDLIPQHSTMSLAPVAVGKLVGGTTIGAGTGGEIKAKVAELYIMDMKTKQIEWHEPVFEGVTSYTDLTPGPKGLVFGFADHRRFFVFDSNSRQIIHEQNTEETFGVTNSQQGPRTFIIGPNNTIYVLFVKGIAKLDPKTFEIKMLVESAIAIGAGGDYLDGRIYFGNASHLYSWTVQ